VIQLFSDAIALGNCASEVATINTQPESKILHVFVSSVMTDSPPVRKMGTVVLHGVGQDTKPEALPMSFF
jgi:hypothetical protein